MSDDFSAISHQFIEAPDWAVIRSESTEVAATRLRSILSDWDTLEDRVFAVRGMCMLLVEERELWTQFIDPEVDQPYKSMDRWIKTVCPKSWSYCYDALRTVKECRAIPFEDLLQIKRCNLETLKKASSNIRVKPKVIEAAKTQTEAQFAQTLSRDHGQHIETKSTLKLTYTAGEMAEVEKALDWVGKQAGIEDRAGQLLALCIDANIEHSEQDAA